MVNSYNPIDNYWFVAGDMSRVWSSKRFAYVSAGDGDYQSWLADPRNITAINPSVDDLSLVMQEQALPVYFQTTGLVVTSQSNTAVNGTYALDRTTLNQIGAVARDVGAGLGLPLGNDSFGYPDINGNIKMLNEQNIMDLYKAMRNFIAATTYAVQQSVTGQSVQLPPNTVTIG